MAETKNQIVFTSEQDLDNLVDAMIKMLKTIQEIETSLKELNRLWDCMRPFAENYNAHPVGD